MSALNKNDWVHDGPYLTAKQAADYLNVTENALAKLRLAGGGPPFVRLGRRIRYGQGAIDSWIHSRTYTTLPPKSGPPV
jgi:excisionase family DNA binding protein